MGSGQRSGGQAADKGRDRDGKEPDPEGPRVARLQTQEASVAGQREGSEARSVYPHVRTRTALAWRESSPKLPTTWLSVSNIVFSP